ncbi:unnamed protein product [Amoebophrya sp. A25]|nr:unnamed protein product [Amoebophrya sp. A25]|eukprot:GSA25T00016216001.1
MARFSVAVAVVVFAAVANGVHAKGGDDATPKMQLGKVPSSGGLSSASTATPPVPLATGVNSDKTEDLGSSKNAKREECSSDRGGFLKKTGRTCVAAAEKVGQVCAKGCKAAIAVPGKAIELYKSCPSCAECASACKNAATSSDGSVLVAAQAAMLGFMGYALSNPTVLTAAANASNLSIANGSGANLSNFSAAEAASPFSG